jgi:hypothetical protein
VVEDPPEVRRLVWLRDEVTLRLLALLRDDGLKGGLRLGGILGWSG